jgi:hypothetical protein
LLPAVTHAVTPFEEQKRLQFIVAVLLSDQKVLQEQQTLQ